MPSLKRGLLYAGAVGILILAIVSFVFIPAFGGSATGEAIVFGKWNGKPIEYAEGTFFLNQMQAIARRMQEEGQQLNDFSYYQIMQTAFNSSVVRLAILDELKKASYKAPESLVNKTLLPYYLDENGRYSSRAFNETPEAVRVSRRKTTREDLTVQRFIEDIFGDQNSLYGLKTSSREADLVKTMSSPERAFEYVSFATTSYPADLAASWGKEHADLFVSHDLSLITFADETAAKRTAAALAKGEYSFEEAVTNFSTRQGTNEDGKLLASRRHELNRIFSDAEALSAVLALEEGAVSSVVSTVNGFALVRVNAAPVNPDFADPSVISAVTLYLSQNERGMIEDYYMGQAAEFAKSASSRGLRVMAADAGLEVKTTAAFPINYGGVSVLTPVPTEANPELAQAAKSEAFFRSAFSVAAGQVSDPVLLGSNVIVLQMTEEKSVDAQFAEMVPMFYNYYAASWAQQIVTDTFLRDKRLEDNFLSTYLEHFMN